jgi:serine/threonine protein kinase
MLMVEKEEIKDYLGKKINNYTITKYINSGSFGMVFEAQDKKTNEFVALKIPIKNKDKDGQKCLLDEAKVYSVLNEEKIEGIAKMKIIKNKDLKIIVMDLLGPSLENLVKKKKQFRLKTIILLTIQLIDIMKSVHNKGYIHRDIKADNFVIDNTLKNKVYCIDFGLSTRYLKRNSDNHIPMTNNHKFCGTARYSGINSHLGNSQSRRDDLESIGYLLIYLYRGSLPWQNIKHKDKYERYRLIGEKKINTTEEELCDKLPKEFLIYLKYVRNLEYDEKPHYSALKNMFIKLYNSKGYSTDKFDWE